MAENMIKFLRGNVASLPQNATAGAVYFTKDEGLYLGLEDGTYHRYGDFITVANVAALPATGAHETCMYYCEEENILAKWDGAEWVQINKQKTLEQLGGVAKSVYEAKIAALEKADTDNAKATSDLSDYVGTFTHDTAKTVVEYINAKTDGIATSGNLEALGARVTTAEGDIDKLEAAIGEGGSVTTAIADAKKAGTDAQADVDALELKVGTVGEGQTVVGLIEAAQTKADQGVTDAAAAKAAADAAAELAGTKATMTQVNEAIAGAGHAVKSEVDQTIAELDAAYKKADGDLKTELEGKIGEKVAQSAYDAKVAELAGADTTLQGNIDAEAKARKDADDAQVERIAALEGTITGLSGAMHFKGVKTEIPEDKTGYTDGDVIIVGDKEYVFNDGDFVEFGDVSAEGDRLAALEALVGKEAEGENAATGLVKAAADNAAAIAAEKARAEGKEAELAQADATNLQAAKDYADDKIADLKIGDYAKQADLDAHTGDAVAHITADERTAWNAAEKNAKDHADTEIKKLADGAVATNTNAITRIDGEIDGLETQIKALTDLGATKVESSATNGNIKVNGAEVTVYTHPAEHAISEVTGLQAALDNKLEADDIANKADKATNLAGYGITDAYTKTEVNTAIDDAVTAALTWGSF